VELSFASGFVSKRTEDLCGLPELGLSDS